MCRGTGNWRSLQIFQHLGEPETFHIVDPVCVFITDVPNAIVSCISRQVFLETFDRTGSTVEILGIAGDTPRVKVGLEDLGSQDVILGSDVEAVLLEERELISGGSVQA